MAGRLFYILSMIVCTHVAMAQSIEKNFDLEKHIESFFSFQDQDVDFDELYESFMNNYLNPVNINSATPADLRGLMMLDELQIQNLINYIAEYGKLLTINELYAVDGYDQSTVLALEPFISFKQSLPQKRTRHEVLLRYTRVLETKKGYQATDDEQNDPAYAGSPERSFFRYRAARPGKFSFSLLAEKDPGESLQWSPDNQLYGFDFTSAHVSLQNKGNLRQLIIGDYQIEAGEQLVLGSGFSFGKGAETINTLKRSDRGLRPYQSVLEHSFFRGIAATYHIPSLNLNITPFISRRLHSASVSVHTDSGFSPVANSLRNSGLHRTQNELNGRNALTEQAWGTQADFSNDRNTFNVGATYLYQSFSLPFQPGEQPFRKFHFRGRRNFNASIYLNYQWKSAFLFAEAAMSKSGGRAFSGGVITRISDQWQTSFLLRHYDKDYHAFYGSGFSERDQMNEYGTYWGLKWQPSRRLTATAFVDIFRFPWLRFRIDAPSHGSEALIRVSYQLNDQNDLFIQYRHKLRQENVNDNAALSELIDNQRDNIILHLNLRPDKWIHLRSRITYSHINKLNNSYGMALAQDANLQIKRFKVYSRMAIFHTDDFDSRQFIYENDLLYAFSIPALQGKGTRYYFMTNYQLNKNISFWIKFSRTTYFNQNTLGTGNEEIMGNKRTELRFQSRITF